MEKILIDGRLLSGKPTGISRYTKEVIHALIAHFGQENICVITAKKYINVDHYNILTTSLKPYNPFHYLLFPFFVNRQNFSIYYSTFYSGLWFKTRGRKQILTVHDLMYLRIKNYFSPFAINNAISKIFLNCIVKSSLRSGNLVISVSNTTKKDLLEYFKTGSNVISEGVNYLEENPAPEVNIFDRFKIRKEKYFLYVGNFRKQKNIPFLVEAFIQSNSPHHLVLVGNNRFLRHENEKIIFTGVLDDYEIQSLYKNCLSFVMPSLYEGFGLPILEAYCAGARVLSANQGALAEFHELGVNYFSPFNLNELVFLLLNSENLPRPTESEIELVRNTYSWQNQTKRIINSIESLISLQKIL